MKGCYNCTLSRLSTSRILFANISLFSVYLLSLFENGPGNGVKFAAHASPTHPLSGQALIPHAATPQPSTPQTLAPHAAAPQAFPPHPTSAKHPTPPTHPPALD